jgi:site-specific recombinase XerD
MPRKPTGQLILEKTSYYGRYAFKLHGEEKSGYVRLNTLNKLLARQRLNAIIKAEIEGRPADVTETFLEAGERILEIRMKTLSSANSERGNLRKHVFPIIGHIPVTMVSEADVVSVLEQVRDKGHAAETIRHIRNAMSHIFKRLVKDKVRKDNPCPPVEDLPEALPETIDERPKAVLSDEEIFTYLSYTDPREGERYVGSVRERQLMTLLARCVGGMRTGELHGLTWARASADDLAFDSLEVIRYKTRKKAAKAGSKAVARQLYAIGDTVIPFFLRFWYLRTKGLLGHAPDPDSVLFPVRKKNGRLDGKGGRLDNVGEKREETSWAKALRRDIKRAYGIEVLVEHKPGGKRKRGQQEWIWKVVKPESEWPRRLQELLSGTQDRRPLWFHNARNAAAIMAERHERLTAAARFTAHTPKMLQHYREMAGEVDVMPVMPELMPDPQRLGEILIGWCRADGIDPGLVFGQVMAPGDEERIVHALAAGPLALLATGDNPAGGAPGGPGRPVVAPPGSTVITLPEGSISTAQLRKALDGALTLGDVELARTLNLLAASLEEQKGGRQ